MAAIRDFDPTRRDVLATVGLSASYLLTIGRPVAAMEKAERDAKQEPEKQGEKEETQVSAPEDLMREHDVLHRILLIYERIIATPGPPAEWPVKTLTEAARLVQTFIEQYHQKLEEDYVFPRFEKAGRLTDLTAVLRKQHDAGIRLTQAILKGAGQLKEPADAERLTRDMRAYIRMYQPHSAREGSVLFAALHTVVPPKGYEEMGDKFEEIEHQKLGTNGFENAVNQVAAMEKTLGIYDLAQFTPKQV
jgi:hemerythrin-like domain-containing protein